MELPTASFALRCLLVLTACIACSAQNGVTLNVYDNTALAGAPASSVVLPSTSFTLPGDAHNGAFSAEMVGTLGFPATAGLYKFNCSFAGSTMGFVWVDGHMVCQDGNVYRPDPGNTDNPLPVNTFNSSRGVVQSLPFRAHFYYNRAMAPQTPVCTSAQSKGVYNDTNHQCGFTAHGSSDQNSWMSASAACALAGLPVAGAENGEGSEIWCGNTLTPNCPLLKTPPALAPCPGNHSQSCGQAWVLEVVQNDCHLVPTPAPAAVGLTVSWEVTPAGQPGLELQPVLPPQEAKRDALQRALASGWGPWLHHNMLALVKLPEAATLTTQLCSKGACIQIAVPDGANQAAGNAHARVGLHAYDRSYVQFFFGPTDAVAANVSVEYSVSGPGNANVDLMIRAESCSGGCSDFNILLDARYAWFKAGAVSTHANGTIGFAPAGLSPLQVHPKATPSNVTATTVELSLASGAVALSSDASATVESITSKLAAARAAEEALLVESFGVTRAAEGQAVKAAAMWTVVSTPAENGGAPLLPVSRSWNFAPNPVNNDFTYAVFDWDNLFATLLAATGSGNSTEGWTGLGYALSNLFQVVKSKTAAGFVPNFAAGGSSSMDRTEPPIGAKVVLELLHKFGKDRIGWAVEVVFWDLLDWNDWFLRKRVHPPLNLIALGTYNDQTHKAGSMQDARFESGLDNSPMYDGDFYNNTDGCGPNENGCGLMDLYDVGMSSMFVQEAHSLAELAEAIELPSSLVSSLKARGDTMAQRIAANLWDEQLGIFVNKFSSNGSFYERITPTSFYALQAKAASTDQAQRMATSWLMNKDRFCISPDGEYTGNDETCYWGLPSVQASDPAFPALGYWRGYVWGPMAQLTFWSLQNYDQVPEVRQARKGLCKQMAGLMMSQWEQHRHICENYNPHHTADTSGGDCSGTKFYHWGALTGLIGLMEDGLF